VLEQVIRSYMAAKGVDLPADPRFTLAVADPTGRVDVAASAALQQLASRHDLTAVLFEVFRPVIDGALTQQLGPARISPVIEQLPSEAQMVLTRFRQ